MDTIQPPPSGVTFRQRCAASLTHPVTLFAVLVLLLNDLVFKALWSNPWTTGKLSDLAWVIFASPLLVTLLSLLAGGGVVRQRVAFLAAYVGLPVLYVAFNTFQPLHDWIMGGFGLLTNGSAGSPLDVTDSLVIPCGIAVALWIWKQSKTERSNLRTRFTLIALGIAAFVTVATSVSSTENGITHIWVAKNGSLVARVTGQHLVPGIDFQSIDGGKTWTLLETPESERELESSDHADTPRGRYVIEGPDIVLISDNGSRKIVYSTSTWSHVGNLWVQERATDRFGVRSLTTAPRSLVFHQESGNVVVAMGIQGVLVGTPDGHWMSVAISVYKPVNYSPLAKAGTLLSDSLFWFCAVVLALSYTLLALTLSQYRERYFAQALGWITTIVFIIMTIPTIMVFAISGIGEVAIFAPLVFPVVAAICTCFIVSVLRNTLSDVLGTKTATDLALAVASAIASGIFMYTFGFSTADVFNTPEWVQYSAGFVAYVFCLVTCVRVFHLLKRWRQLLLSLTGMLLIVMVVFTVWIQTGISTPLAKFSAIALVVVATFTLSAFLSRREGLLGPTAKTSSDAGGNTS